MYLKEKKLRDDSELKRLTAERKQAHGDRIEIKLKTWNDALGMLSFACQ